MIDELFCDCGVTLERGEDQCRACAGAPHHRECYCDECCDYWRELAERSAAAAERFNRQLVCSCGWTGPYIEHHRERGPACVVTKREEAATA